MIRRQSNFAHAKALGPKLLAGLGVASVGVTQWPFTVDDGFIVARYARNLASGEGYAMNPGVPSDGVTGPLWLLPGWAAEAVGLSAVSTAKLLGLFCTVLAVVMVLGRVASRSSGRLGGWLFAVFALCQPSLGGWSVAGLETGAATLALSACALAATRRPKPSPLGAGAAGAVLAWLRPELALAVGALLASLWWRAARDATASRGARSQRATALGFAVAALGAASVGGFRLVVFGHVLPLAFAAKRGALAEGLTYTASAVVLVTSLAGLVACLEAVRSGRRDDRVWVAALALHLVALVVAGGDWMPGYRLLVPVLPLYGALLASQSARAWLRGKRWALAVFALSLAVPLADLTTRVPDVRAAGQRRDTRGAELADWMAQRGRSVALVDAGYLAFASQMEVVDLGGLTDDVIATSSGGHLSKRVPESYLRRRDPDLILLHSTTPPRIEPGGGLSGYHGYPVERGVLAMQWVQSHYDAVRVVAYAPGYHYVVLARAPRQGVRR